MRNDLIELLALLVSVGYFQVEVLLFVAYKPPFYSII